jgi:excisionase family DNA binding protein
LATDLQEILALPLGDEPPPVLGGGPIAQPIHVAMATPLPASPFLCIAEAASWLGVSVSTVKRLIGRGELTTVRIGGRRKIPNTALLAYVRRDVMLPALALSNESRIVPYQ